MTCLKFISSIFCVFSYVCGHEIEVEEYCLPETFEARCQQDEVIMIQHASFGRMKIGRCVEVDMGYLGCSSDVLTVLDTSCSGKTECKYPVLHADLQRFKPCMELMSYLEVSYTCFPVVTSNPTTCSSSRPVAMYGINEGFLSSYVARKTGCGSSKAPWKIEVLPGQQINVSIISFDNKSAKSHTIGNRCIVKGYISELGHKSNFTICNSPEKEQHVYTSNGRGLEIRLVTESVSEKNGEFLLKYKVFGCVDLMVPKFGWYKRDGNFAVIGCEHQERSWHLQCNGSRWIGVVGNCSERNYGAVEPSTSWINTSRDFTQTIIISIVVCCLLLMLVCGVVCAVKCSKRGLRQPPSTKVLEQEILQPIKHPLAVDDSDHYKSLMVCKSPPDSYPHHWNTMSRHNYVPTTDSINDKRGYDRNCSSLPWVNQPKYTVDTNQFDGHTRTSICDNENECPKYFILDKELVNNQI